MEIQSKMKVLILILLVILIMADISVAQYGILFDDDDANISFGDVSVFDVEHITTEAWIKLSDYRPGVIIAKPGAYYFRVNDDLILDAGIYNETDENWFTVTGITELDINEFYHVAFTHDGSYLRIYLNGALEASTPYSRNIEPLLTNGLYAGSHFFMDDYSDYTYAGEDTKIYLHENYGGAYQEIDLSNDYYRFSGTNTYPNGVADEAISTMKTLTTLDHIMSIDVLWEQQEGNAYITQRFADVTDKYEIAIDPEWDGIYFNKVVNNFWSNITWTDLDETVENDTWYNLKSQLITSGSTYYMRGWFDDVLYIDSYDSDLDDEYVGVITHDHDGEDFTYHVYYDNWQVDIPFKGIIDEIRIFDTAVPQNTIIAWMCQLLTGSHPNWSDLQGYWRFDDHHDPTEDNSSNSNEGDIVNASFVSSKVPEGYACHSGSGNNDLIETVDVPVSIRWDSNLPGSGAIYNVMQINDYPNQTDGLYINYPSVYWEILIYNHDGSFNADVDFHYDNLGPISDESALSLFTRSSTGDSWTLVSNITINDEGINTDGIGYITANNLTSFSQFIISSNSEDNSLPVELTSFTARVEDNKVILNWRTESEIDNRGFEIERSIKGEQNSDYNWGMIGFVSGQGNYSSFTNYSFIDADLENSGKYFYRLKQIDTNGRYIYSSKLEVNYINPAEHLASDYYLSQNYPNPFNPITTIQYRLPVDSHLRLIVYDLLGREVAELYNGISELGDHSIKFNACDLENGIYYYRIQARSLDNKHNFTTTRKMTLLK